MKSFSLIVSMYAAVLFFLLTPNVLLRLPPQGSKMTVAAVHSLVFLVIFAATYSWVYSYFSKTSNVIPTLQPTKRVPPPPQTGSVMAHTA